MYYDMIVNRTSRSGKGGSEIEERLKQALQRAGHPYAVHLTHGLGDPERIAAEITGAMPERDGEHAIVAIGGDGTINGVLNGIRDFSKVKFGFLPAGSANDLARGLGMPDPVRDRIQAETIRHIADGAVRRTIDLGELRYGDKRRLFAVSAGIGFDAAVCQRSDDAHTRTFFNALHLGALTYGTIALGALISAPKVPCEIRTDTGEILHIGEMVFAAFMNTPYEGGGYKFAPDARPDDGRINISVVGDMPKLRVLLNFPSAHRGTYYKVPGVRHTSAREIYVRAARPLWVHTDGEVQGTISEFEIRCLPGALKMIV